MRGLTVWALVAAAVLLPACTTSTTESTTTPTTLAVDLLREAKFTARAVEDIVDAVGTETVQLRDVNFYPQYLIVELQDPEIPEHIDEYEWRNGSVEPPEPVQLTGPQEAIEAELFPSTAVNWRTLPQRVREAEAAAEANRPLRVEDARGQYLFVERSTSPELDGRVILRIYLQGPRRGGYVEMTSSGEILSVIVG